MSWGPIAANPFSQPEGKGSALQALEGTHSLENAVFGALGGTNSLENMVFELLQAQHPWRHRILGS